MNRRRHRRVRPTPLIAQPRPLDKEDRDAWSSLRSLIHVPRSAQGDHERLWDCRTHGTRHATHARCVPRARTNVTRVQRTDIVQTPASWGRKLTGYAVVEKDADGHDCCQLRSWPCYLGRLLTRRGTSAHLRVEEEDLLRLRLLLAVQTVGERSREQQRLARLRVGLDQHAAQGDVANDAAETV